MNDHVIIIFIFMRDLIWATKYEIILYKTDVFWYILLIKSVWNSWVLYKEKIHFLTLTLKSWKLNLLENKLIYT